VDTGVCVCLYVLRMCGVWMWMCMSDEWAVTSHCVGPFWCVAFLMRMYTRTHTYAHTYINTHTLTHTHTHTSTLTYTQIECLMLLVHGLGKMDKTLVAQQLGYKLKASDPDTPAVVCMCVCVYVCLCV